MCQSFYCFNQLKNCLGLILSEEKWEESVINKVLNLLVPRFYFSVCPLMGVFLRRGASLP